MQLGMLLILLSDGAKEAKRVLAEFEPMFASKDEYLAFIDAFNKTGDRIEYTADETSAKVNML